VKQIIRSRSVIGFSRSKSYVHVVSLASAEASYGDCPVPLSCARVRGAKSFSDPNWMRLSCEMVHGQAHAAPPQLLSLSRPSLCNPNEGMPP
jgi:hypothetical protein